MHLWLLLLAAAPALVQARDYCGAGCYSAVKEVATFPKCKAKCESKIPQMAGTVAFCIQDHCKNTELAWKRALEQADEVFSSAAKGQYQAILANATLYEIPQPADLDKPLYSPTHLDADLIVPWIKSRVAKCQTQFTYPETFSWVVLMFTGAVVAGAALRYAWLTLRSHRSVDGRQPKARALAVYTKKYLLMPAIFHSTSNRPSTFGFTWSLPTRLQTILVLLLVMINAIACGWQLQTFEGDPNYPNKTQQTIRFVADRAGTMAVWNMPLLFAFAGRNNILIWVTGSTFDTFNVFHKWLGRIVVSQVFVHGVLYTHRYLYQGREKLYEKYDEPYVRWGIVALVAGSLIIAQAVHVSRKYYYETFLVAHIILVVLFAVGAWHHLRLNDYKLEAKWGSYVSWVLAACVIWAFDRFIRLVRLVLTNLNWKNGKLSITQGVVKELAGGFFQISIKVARDFPSAPGQYIFLHFGKHRHFVQSHPFSILAYEEQGNTPASSTDEKTSIDSISKGTHGADGRVLTLVVRQHKGVTKQLTSLSLEQPSAMLVEGPYGKGLPLGNYDNLTLLAGGVGISAMLGHVRDANKQTHRMVHFIWIVHKQDEVKGLLPFLLKTQHPHLKLSIYVTSSKDIEKSTASLQTQTFEEADITWGHGRPVVADLLAHDAAEAGSWAVVACGPGGLLDDARAACVGLLTQKPETIDFFSEGFEW